MEKKDIQQLIEVLGRGVRERELFKSGLEVAQSVEGLLQFEKEIKDRIDKLKISVLDAEKEKEKANEDLSFVKADVANAKTEAKTIIEVAKKKASELINDVQLKTENEKQKLLSELDLIRHDIKNATNDLSKINISIAAASDELNKLQRKKEEFFAAIKTA